MGQQRVKEGASQEGKKVKDAPKEEKKVVVKKWKGKDWFSIMGPKEFGGSFVADTPTTDPKTLVGRNVEVNVSDFMGQPQKYYMKMKLRINSVQGKEAHTNFNGYFCLKEHISRFVRKGSQKVMLIDYFTTKDDWNIQVYTVAILNRNTDHAVQKAIRKAMKEYLDTKTKTTTMEEFMKAVIAGIHQKHIKRTFSKIYPIRFSEITKIEVIKSPIKDGAEPVKKKQKPVETPKEQPKQEAKPVEKPKKEEKPTTEKPKETKTSSKPKKEEKK